MMATFEGLASLQNFQVPQSAYTKLSADQMERAARYGIQQTYSSSTNLYHQGERGAHLYVVLAGAVQVFWSDAVDAGELFITLEPGEFTGELNLLNERE